MIKIKRGLDLPLEGAPNQTIDESKAQSARSVALVGFDYQGMKPTMEVQEGDSVKLGDLLFTDKKNVGVKYTAPGAGTVTAINRGEKRALQSVVIELQGDAEVSFDPVAVSSFASLDQAKIRDRLIDSGLWTAFRTRPFSKVPAIDAAPQAIFVTAMDTNPIAADPAVIIAREQQHFEDGLTLLKSLSSTVYCCTSPDSSVSVGNSGASVEQFDGPHPAGLAGTHIHYLAPASANRSVWSINYQDVIAVGALFTQGKIKTSRVVALAGPQISNPRLVETRLGANIDELLAGELKGEGEVRPISGSVLSGRKAAGAYAYLGRYHTQVCALIEGRDRELLSYVRAGTDKHSVSRLFLSAFTGAAKRFAMTTTTNGSERAMVPIGNFEKVMPLDILPTQLLRALVVGDTASAQELGCLELDEEDLALCTYACSGKYEYGPILRDNLTRIEKEG